MTTILLSVIGALIATLILEKAPSISHWLITKSTGHLPIENRNDRRNQWLADSEHVSGPASKLMHACGCSWLCRTSIFRSLGQSVSVKLKRLKKTEKLEKPRINITIDGGLLSNIGIVHEKVKPSNRPPLLLHLPDDGWRIDGLDAEEHRLCTRVLRGESLDQVADADGRSLEEIQSLAEGIVTKTGFPSFAHFCTQLAKFGVEGDQ